MTYQVIDTHNGREVVAEYPTRLRAFNAANRLEGTKLCPDAGWRYLVSPVRPVSAQGAAR